jgi:hypothetical protein
VGSFTEVTLAMTFAAGTPPEVVGAFAEWRDGEHGPPLPSLEQSLGRDDLDDLAEEIDQALFSDPTSIEQLPELHHATWWRWLLRSGPEAYFPGIPAARLTWFLDAWRLEFRALAKTDAAGVAPQIARLGRHATDGDPDRPWFAGYIFDEQEGIPMLVWSVGQAPFRIVWAEPLDPATGRR